jgi:hypothetical protein
MKLRAFLVLAAVAALLVIVFATKPTGTSYRQVIVDVSWPNCGKLPKDVFGTGIVGINGGLDFHPNPCLADESTWFSHYSVYMNTGYPGDARGRKFINSPRRCGFSESACLAYNYGFNAARYSIKYANTQNVHANTWWLDVETENSWTNNVLVNRQFLEGAITAIRQQVLVPTVGIYSAPHQWDEIVGPWLTRQPVWLATGSTSRADAAKACHGQSFTGGPIQLTQYTPRLDENFPCY